MFILFRFFGYSLDEWGKFFIFYRLFGRKVRRGDEED